MSFILDALKKSENERQQQNVPGLASIPQPGAPKNSSKWIWLVASLLTVNLAVLAGILIWSDNKMSTTEAVTVPVPEDPATATFSEIVSEVKRNQPELAEIAPAPAPETGPSDEAATESESPQAQVSDINSGLDSFDNLRARGVLQLPDMHLDIHVYGGSPEDRFVFVNMTKYKENAVLSEGPRLLEITPEGIVLEHQNLKFLLPRQ